VHFVAEFLSFPTIPNTLDLAHVNPPRSAFRWDGSKVFANFRPVKGLIQAHFAKTPLFNALVLVLSS
jgi:hypothetical protein